MHYVLGTAGHIDHGKSAIVKALTGTDPDRLKEERERGMTTDLGFAFLGEEITIIDVPGHERFVRHMLAGASTIDLVLLVVAGDDGVMPQTKEHFEICRLLGIKNGVVVINKVDLVEQEWLEIVREDIRQLVRDSFLDGAPMVEVSAKTGQGIAELRKIIEEQLRMIEPKPDRGVFRLPIDRCFSIKGFGTVVAGTVLSGKCEIGDRLEILPFGIAVRVRGIQKHNQPVESVAVGERAALNLHGVEPKQITRGNVLVTPGYYQPTKFLNASLYLLKDVNRPLKNMTQVHLHIGTAEMMCRVCLLDKKEIGRGESGLVQLRTEEPVVCDWNDRYVLRYFSPPATIGGGVILEVVNEKSRRFDRTLVARLEQLKSGEKVEVLEQFLVRSGFNVKTVSEIVRGLTITEQDTTALAAVLVSANKARWVDYEGRSFLIHRQVLANAIEVLRSQLKEYHRQNPFRTGVKQAELRMRVGNMPLVLYNFALSELRNNGEVVFVDEGKIRLTEHSLKLTPEQQSLFDRIAEHFREAKWTPPDIETLLSGVDQKLAQIVRLALVESGVLIDIGEGILLHRTAVELAKQRLIALAQVKSRIVASEFRQDLATTRKIAIPLLNYFDSGGITQRKGDVRVLRKRDDKHWEDNV